MQILAFTKDRQIVNAFCCYRIKGFESSCGVQQNMIRTLTLSVSEIFNALFSQVKKPFLLLAFLHLKK